MTILRTIASCRPMFPTVTPPEKKIQGSQERMYRKSGDVYLQKEKEPPGESVCWGHPVHTNHETLRDVTISTLFFCSC